MKKKFFLIFFLSLWSIVAFAQTEHFERKKIKKNFFFINHQDLNS